MWVSDFYVPLCRAFVLLYSASLDNALSENERNIETKLSKAGKNS